VTVVDAYASRIHYLDAISPVWRALGPARGHLLVPAGLAGRVAELGLSSLTDGGTRGDTILTASWADARSSRQWRTVALMEHGVGQSYEIRHPAYAGDPDRCGWVDVFLCPNERVAALNRAACPTARTAVVGTPWLDDLARIDRRPDVDVAVSFHWDGGRDLATGGYGCPEMACTADEWWPTVVALSDRYRVLGHGHPRAQPVLFPRWADIGVETAARFEEVAARAHVFAADNTSCLFYAAALGLGVVVLDSARYRRHVDHGLRFWDAADIGFRAGSPGELPGAVDAALTGPTARAADIVADLFPWRGVAAGRAADVLAAR
jgi:hypothetical protein